MQSRPGYPSLFRTLSILLAVLSVSSLSRVDASDRAPVWSREQREHWAYQKLALPAIPELAAESRVRCENPIDVFVEARLAARALAPAKRASREVLIRRATIDLTGLPPSLEEIDDFLADENPDAFERLLDRLLASPRHGERWARHWLDAVRYAESDGFKSDKYRPGSWRYRDYVIRALNTDRPHDRFVMEQIAGDELWPGDADSLVATGFLRHWAYEDNGRDLDRAWDAILADITSVTGQTFLGLSVGCARCHDHKFDAISQRDFFAFQAFFAAIVPRDDLPVGTPAELERYSRELALWVQATRKARDERAKVQARAHQSAQRARGDKFPPLVQAILEKPEAERSLYERQLVHLAGAQLTVATKSMASRMSDEVKARWQELNAEIGRFDDLRPKGLPVARGVRDIGMRAPPVRLPGDSEELAPGFLTVLSLRPPRIEAPSTGAPSTGRRAALARWLVSGENPLTRRVSVNRIWQHHFGEGIVATASEFGARGARPSHPRLLDWLAVELERRSWSTKELHRLMMSSALYRRVATPPATHPGFSIDTENALLWRRDTRRVEAEVLRDSLLSVSGELELEIGGESVYPALPKGFTGRYGWKASADERVRMRRSIYLAVKRNMQLPLLKTFDLPDNHFTCARRDCTTTATQALMLLNEDWVLARARAFAGRVLRRHPVDREFAVVELYRLALGRVPRPEEITLAMRFLERQRELVAKRISRGEKVYAPERVAVAPDVGAAFVDFADALFNANEFVYVD